MTTTDILADAVRDIDKQLSIGDQVVFLRADAERLRRALAEVVRDRDIFDLSTGRISPNQARRGL